VKRVKETGKSVDKRLERIGLIVDRTRPGSKGKKYAQVVRQLYVRMSGSSLQNLLENMVVAVDGVVFLAKRGDGSAGVKYSSVVPVAKSIPDVR